MIILDPLDVEYNSAITKPILDDEKFENEESFKDQKPIFVSASD